MPDEPTLPIPDEPMRLIGGIAPVSAAPTIGPSGPLSSAGSSVFDAVTPGASRLGNYELVGEIARGGMGVVFRARQIGLNRIVALKMILTGPLAGDAALQRFRIEATAAAQLDHPNIVPIYEVGEDAGQHFFSMKLVEGGSVADHLQRYLGNPHAAATMLSKVARAVHFAHQRGILHRDLKPANVLLDSAGEPLVSDFGLAKWDQLDANLTHADTCLGTPGYMAPEQAKGSQGMSTSADIYSLGAILYQCLTGLPPFTGGNVAEVLRKLIDEEPVPPRTLGKSVPHDLEIICLKCLSKEPRQRYPSAEALADDLDRFVHGEPIEARAVGTIERIWRWCRRKPALATAGAVAIVAVIGAIITLSIAVVKISAARNEERRQFAARVLENANSKLADGEAQQGIVTLVEALQLSEESGQPELARTIRQQLGVWRNSVSSLQGIFDHGGPVSMLAGSSDGRLVVSADEGGFKVWDTSLNRSIASVRLASGSIRALSIDQTGRQIATGCDDGKTIVWTSAGQQEKTLALNSPVIALAFDRTGTLLAVATEDQLVHVCDVALGRELKSFPMSAKVTSIAFDSTGRMLLVATDDGTISEMGVDGGAVVRTQMFSGEHPRLARFDESGNALVVSEKYRLLTSELKLIPGREISIPEGTAAVAMAGTGLLITGGDDGVARLWDVRIAQAIGAPVRHPSRITSVICSEDGSRFVVACVDGSIRKWQTARGEASVSPLRSEGGIQCMTGVSSKGVFATGDASGLIAQWELSSGKMIRSIHTGSPIMSLGFASDGTRIVAGDQDGKVRLWDATSGEAASDSFIVSGENAWVDGINVSPEGRCAVVSANDGVARIWDLASVKFLENRLEHQEAITCARYSSDGSRILTASRDATARLWDARTGEAIGEPLRHEGIVWSAIFAGKGRFSLTCGADPALHVWDARNGASVASIPHHQRELLLLAIDGNEKVVAAGSRDGTVSLWHVGDLAKGELELRQSVKVNGTINAMTFSPDGNLLVVGSSDNSARLIDTRNGESVGMPLHHAAPVMCVQFDMNSRLALTADAEGAVRVWPVAPVETPTLQLSKWAQEITGVERGTNGAFAWISPDQWRQKFAKSTTQPAN
jgi:WD40 repeat protein